MKRTLFASAIALATAAPAFAADLPQVGPPPPQAPAAYVPPPSPIYNWGGVYVGFNAGGSWINQGNTAFTCTGAICATGTSSGQSFSNSGFTGGGQVGFNFQSGQFVFGLEGDAEYLSNKSNVVVTDFGGGGATHAYTTDFLSTVRGRLGFAWDRALFYGTGGLAMATYQVQRTQNTTGLDVAGATQTVNNFRIGWAAGAGIEYAFTDNITGRVEYLVAGLESATDTYNFPFSGSSVTASSPTEYINIVRGGLNFKFNPW